jgi:hypothetical protein
LLPRNRELALREQDRPHAPKTGYANHPWIAHCFRDGYGSLREFSRLWKFDRFCVRNAQGDETVEKRPVISELLTDLQYSLSRSPRLGRCNASQRLPAIEEGILEPQLLAEPIGIERKFLQQLKAAHERSDSFRISRAV